MEKAEADLRRAVVDAARQMNTLGINQGTSGNISVRHGSVMLITPSATPYEVMQPEQLAAMSLGAQDDAWTGPLKPSTEWRFHRAILQARPDAGAVIHTHAVHCTALSIARRNIPACHYMVGLFGGSSVRCAPYAAFGTAALARHALVAMQDRCACLLANHGMIVAGPTVARALWLAVELETLARQYIGSLQAGGAVLLTELEVEEARRAFAGYGLQE